MMITYWILPHPGFSAVFFDASEGLSMAELTLCLRTLKVGCAGPRAEARAGLRWYAFDVEAALAGEDLRSLSQLSSLYALFVADGTLLSPVETQRDTPFPDDLSAILKYTGKTNALFTRLMLHLAALSLPARPAGPLRLLDPVCGKGTTLFEAAMRGWDAAGIEIVQKAAHEAAVYFEKYLQTGRWKHALKKVKSHGAPTWQFAYARDKEGLKARPGHLTLIAGDAKIADQYYGKDAFDILAGDLPYGVAHGNIAGASMSRSPKALLSACLPAWHRTLRPGGVLALSWNTFVLSTVDMVALLSAHGFRCLTDPPYDALAHRVDAAIRRDIAIAVKD